MDLRKYFDENQGMGVLATADSEGKVNAAVYARPHMMDDGSLAFIMRDRLSHSNLQSNPYAAFLFREKGEGYKGMRLHLRKTHEESGTPLVRELCRRCKIGDDPNQLRFLVKFSVEKQLPLIGAEEALT